MTHHQSEYYISHLGGTNLDFRIRRIGWNCGRPQQSSRIMVPEARITFSKLLNNWKIPGSNFLKKGLPDTPTIEQWLLTTLPQGATIAIDGTLFGASKTAAMKQNFGNHGFS